MSSHHFVKEGQEPALIIANGQFCSEELMGQLLEWSPFVLVLDGAIDKILDKKIKIDAILGDFDSTEKDFLSLKTAHMAPLEIIDAVNQEKTDLEKGIDYLIQKNFKAINIICASGKRADHFLANLISIARFDCDIVLYDDFSKVYKVKSGFKKYFEKNNKISLFPMTSVIKLNTKNLVWNTENENLELATKHSSSNRVKENGIVEISFESGNLIVMECVD